MWDLRQSTIEDFGKTLLVHLSNHILICQYYRTPVHLNEYPNRLFPRPYWIIEYKPLHKASIVSR